MYHIGGIPLVWDEEDDQKLFKGILGNAGSFPKVKSPATDDKKPASFDDISGEIWSEMQKGTPFETPKSDKGDYTSDFYGEKTGEGIDFALLVDFLKRYERNNALLLDWKKYARTGNLVQYSVKDSGGGNDVRYKLKNLNVPYTYTDDYGNKVATSLSAAINKRIDNLAPPTGKFFVQIRPNEKKIVAELIFNYQGTDGKIKERSETEESDDYEISRKYLGVILSTTSLTDFVYLCRAILDKNTSERIQGRIAQKYLKALKTAPDALSLKFLYENLPDFLLPSLSAPSNSEIFQKHLHILKSYDDTGLMSMFKDSSGAMINLLIAFAITGQLYPYLKDNPILIKELYYNMDGRSSIYGVEEKNRMTFASTLLVLCMRHGYVIEKDANGKDKVINTYEINRLRKVDSNVMSFFDKEPDKIFLRQLLGEDREVTYRTDYGARTDTIGVDFSEKSNGAYYHPLAPVWLVEGEGKNVKRYVVPAIYAKAIADEEEWKDIMHSLRIGLDIIAIVGGIATLGAATGLTFALLAADVGLASADLMIALLQDPLMNTSEGKEFLNIWDKIYFAGGVLTAGPLLVSSVASLGTRLLSQATIYNTRNYLTSCLMKIILETNVSNFSGSTLRLLDTAVSVTKESKGAILLKEAERLQGKGVIFCTSVQEGESFLHVFYKGEVIAEGEHHAVRKALKDVLNKQGPYLEEALDRLSVMGRIDDVIKELDIKILVPKNTLNAVESARKMDKIIASLKSKKPFNPGKDALKKLGIKLSKSRRGTSVDFADTPYLYPVTGEQKNIVKIKMTGDRKLDKRLAYELSGIAPDKNYTWHHLDDYDPITNTCTMQLVSKEIHEATYPHYGAVALIEEFLNIIYK